MTTGFSAKLQTLHLYCGVALCMSLVVRYSCICVCRKRQHQRLLRIWWRKRRSLMLTGQMAFSGALSGAGGYYMIAINAHTHTFPSETWRTENRANNKSNICLCSNCAIRLAISGNRQPARNPYHVDIILLNIKPSGHVKWQCTVDPLNIKFNLNTIHVQFPARNGAPANVSQGIKAVASLRWMSEKE